MSALLIFDQYGMDEEPALTVQTDNITAIRESLRKALLQGQGTTGLRVRMRPEYRHYFADFIGMYGMDCLDIKPRLEFKKRFNLVLPAWVDDGLLANLGFDLLSDDLNIWADDIAGWILYKLEPELINPESWLSFCHSVIKPRLRNSGLLKIYEIRQRLIDVTQKFLPSSAMANTFIDKIISHSVPEQVIINWGRQQLYETIRSFSNTCPMALPPRTEPVDFIKALPFIFISAEDAGSQLVSTILRLLKNTLDNVEHKLVPADQLAELVLVDWPAIMTLLVERFNNSRMVLASEKLLHVLDGFSSQEAIGLKELIKQQLASCTPLLETADMKSAKTWIDNYLNYTLNRFLIGQEPDDIVSSSFSAWVLQQQARIARSDMDWRQVSVAIRDDLSATNNRIIVCMMDGLSALHNSQIVEILSECLKSEDLFFEKRFLIAPYPTLTEIGKNAVLTGKPVNETNGSLNSRLHQSYKDFLENQDSIQIIKGWTDHEFYVPEKTRLLVYLENRIDDYLHGCPDYGKLYGEIEVVIKQLAKDIGRWISQSLKHGFDPVVFVTADHGVSYIRNSACNDFSSSSDFIGDYSERNIALYSGLSNYSSNKDFVKTEAQGKHYVFPLRRIRLQGSNPLSHGGLTPEELLIPYISLRKKVKHSSNEVLMVSLKKENALALKDGWQLELNLQACCMIQSIRLEVAHPFVGVSGPHGPLQQDESITVMLNIATDLPQEGFIQVALIANFFRPDMNLNTQICFNLDVHFPPRLLDKDAQTQAFDAMFG